MASLASVFIVTLLWTLAVPSLSAAPPAWSDGSPIRLSNAVAGVADWNGLPERRWPGPALWCNRLQDWYVRDGALYCDAEDRLPCRTAHLLTCDLSANQAPFRLRVTLGFGANSERAGFAGFLVGAGEGRLDYRGAALVHHFPGKGGGILAVIEAAPDGPLVFRDMSAETNTADYPVLGGQQSIPVETTAPAGRAVTLQLEGIPTGEDVYSLRLSAWAAGAGKLLGAAELAEVSSAKLRGNVALVSHSAGRDVVHSFSDFRVGGERLAHHPDHAFGPVAGTLYTVSRRTLKLSAQFMDLGSRITVPAPKRFRRPGRGGNRMRPLATLEARQPNGEWVRVDGPKPIIGPDFYVPFRVENWDATRDVETRVVFEDLDGTVYHYRTLITRDPVDQPVLSVAGFTGMGVMGRVAHARGPAVKSGEIVVGRWTPANIWMPFTTAVDAVKQQKIDLLAFTGDQIYEGKPSPKVRAIEPKEDYLYKLLLWHWSFRELTNHLPATVQPDDHDVYHGNLWGWGGRLNLTGWNADGGYIRSPYFVDMVHRTQTGHLPDPYDPRPARNGISNYYTTFTWGGVGFAVLEDRKFKSPPPVDDPARQTLLGARQEQMLRRWGEDWSGQYFKCAISQTIYASMHVSFNGKLAADRDTDGFPKPRRDTAVRLFRRCGAFVLSGDQHLATLARLGVEHPSDGVYEFAVPAIGNIFWRWFYPVEPGADRRPGDPDYTGEFVDGFGNYFRMIAVANPERRALLGQRLRQRYLIPVEEARAGLGDAIRPSHGDGYGIVRFHKDTRRITIECWPHNADPARGGKQFTGWPATLEFADLDGRRPVAWLPDLEVTGATDPVVQIIDEATGGTVKITRIQGAAYSPGVFSAEGTYTLRVGVPERQSDWWTAKGLKPSTQRSAKKLEVKLR